MPFLFEEPCAVDWPMVDAILVSNSHSLALLPYITELKGFRGKVLSTEPVVRLGKYVVFIDFQHFARVIIEDLFKEMENLSSDAIAQASQKRFEVKIIFKKVFSTARWLLQYTREQAATSLSKVQTLAYHEFVVSLA